MISRIRALLPPVVVVGGLLGACDPGGGAPERDCREILWWIGAADRVSVVGDWNDWDPEADPLLPYDGATSPAWRIQLDLPAGDWRYLLEVDGTRVLDPLQPLLAVLPGSGGEVSLLRVDDCGEPALELEEAEASPDGAVDVRATFLRRTGGQRLGEARATLPDRTPLACDTEPATGALRCGTAGLPTGKHTVLVEATDEAGIGATLRVPLWVEDAPFAWEDALVYQVVVDRFAGPSGELPDFVPGTLGGRLGGDLPGLTAVLRSGYFEALGVNALWISPVYRNPAGWWDGVDGNSYQSYHGYWPVSTDTVEPRFGGEEALDELVAEAHVRGIRVLLDVVPNHVHLQHPWYRSHAATYFHGDAGCVCGSTACPWSTHIESCWFTAYLPDLALEDTSVARTVMASTAAWAARFDVDGFRVDAVPMMPRAAVRELAWALGPLEPGEVDFYTLGETYTGEDWGAIRQNLGPWGLDGQFEFPLLWALRTFAAGGDAADLEDVVARSEAAWEGSGSVMSVFVGNHDTTRILSELAGDDTSDAWGNPPPVPAETAPYERLLLAQALALSLPGAPTLYYGDEYGQAGAGDPDCRRPMRFSLADPQAWTLAQVRRLGQARRCSDALRRGRRVPLVAAGPVVGWLRDAGDGLPAVVLANASEGATTAVVRIPADLALEPDSRFGDALGAGSSVPFSPVLLSPGQILSVDLPARSARVLLPEGSGCLP